MKQKISFLPLVIIIIGFALAFYFYPQMPEKVVSHWDINGEPNGYMPKFWGLFLLPGLSVIMYLLFWIVPKMDPKKENIEKFRSYYDNLVSIILAFLLYIYVLTILWSLGTTFNFNQFIIPPFAVLFYYIGVVLQHAEMNWSIGIRTPWTLENKHIWNKTHRLGSIMFKTSAAIGLIGLLLPQYAFLFILTPITFSVLFTVFYSYYLFAKKVK
jgi:uncharacterized membrane protein